MSVLILRLDRKLQQMLDEASKRRGQKRADVARDALRRQLLLAEFDQLHEIGVRYGQAAGYLTDEDVFRDVS